MRIIRGEAVLLCFLLCSSNMVVMVQSFISRFSSRLSVICGQRAEASRLDHNNNFNVDNPNIIVRRMSSSGSMDTEEEWDESDAWDTSLELQSLPFVSSLTREDIHGVSTDDNDDTLWSLIKAEASQAVSSEPEAGPQIYQSILSQPSLLHGLTQIICNEVAGDGHCYSALPATSLRNLFFDTLTPEDDFVVHRDVMAVTMRSASVRNAMSAVLFHRGLHTLVCHRLAHRLWRSGRRSLATFLQSTMSAVYAADIHPNADIGAGVYLNAGGGVVIGETAVIGDGTSVLQGVTLGGTGKERGNRHPKVGKGVTLYPGSTVLGNIIIGDGAVITAKSIVTKPVNAYAMVAGIPAKIVKQEGDEDGVNSKNRSNNYGSDLSREDHRARLLKYRQFLQQRPATTATSTTESVTTTKTATSGIKLTTAKRKNNNAVKRLLEEIKDDTFSI